MAFLPFNATQVQPQTNFDPIPAGKYICQIVESEIKPTKAGTGQQLVLTWEVLDGEFKGRKVWDRLNISNPNKQAEQISQAALSAICHAAGVLQLQDSAQLHNKPMRIRVNIKKSEGYEPSNEVKGYEAVAGTAAPSFTAPGFQQQAPQQQAAPAANTPPWAAAAGKAA
jgi:hypothetical protein